MDKGQKLPENTVQGREISGPARRAIFLDRDGVLVRPVIHDGKPYPASNLEEVELYPDVAAWLQRFKDAGFLLIVVTNQPDVARGSTSRETVESINNYLSANLPLDAIYTCYHDDPDACDCRKPLPGLLTKAARYYGIALAESFMIGDRWRDVDAGAGAGCRTIWIDYGYKEQAPSVPPNARVFSFEEASEQVFKFVSEGTRR